MVHRDAHPVPLVQKDSNREMYRNIHIHSPYSSTETPVYKLPSLPNAHKLFSTCEDTSEAYSHTTPRRATMATEQPSRHAKGRASCGKPHTEDRPERGQNRCSINAITAALKERNLMSLEHTTLWSSGQISLPFSPIYLANGHGCLYLKALWTCEKLLNTYRLS